MIIFVKFYLWLHNRLWNPIGLPIVFGMLEKHIHLVAKTGSGKSQLIRYLIHKLVLFTQKRNSGSVVLIDPHADLCKSILQLPHWKNGNKRVMDTNRVVYIDPLLGEKENRYPTINPFDIPNRFRTNESFLQALSNELVEALGAILPESGISTYMKTLLEPMVYVLLKRPGSDLRDLKRFLIDGMNDDLVTLGKLSSNSEYAQFFTTGFDRKEYQKTKTAVYTRLQYLLNKPAFLHTTCGRSTIDLYDAMQEGKVILFSFSRSLLGSDCSQVLSRLMLSMVNMMILRNGKVAEQYRKKVYLFLDEFQTMISPLLTTMLSEGRKYALTMLLSHQNLGQLPRDLEDSVVSNTDIKIMGRNGLKTLKTASADTGIPMKVLQSLQNYQFAIKSADAVHIPFTVPKAFVQSSTFRLSEKHTTDLLDWLVNESGYYEQKVGDVCYTQSGKDAMNPMIGNEGKGKGTGVYNDAHHATQGGMQSPVPRPTHPPKYTF